MTTENPKISVIVPVYKVERYLPRCLDSILAQTFTDWECILIDDGSPDNSGAICDEYAKKDSRFQVVHQENKGVSAARNAGLDAARGEWIGFVDSDDWVEKNFLHELYDKACLNNADVAVCGIFEHTKAGRKNRVYTLPKEKEEILYWFIIHPDYMNYPVNKIYRKQILKKDIRFPLGIAICEDLWFCFRVCFFAQNVVSVNVPLYHYNRLNLDSATNNYKLKYFEDKVQVTNNIMEFLNEQECNSVQYSVIINFYKVYAKLPLLIYSNLRDKELWKKTFPEANKYIWKIPLRFDFKLMSWFASRGFFSLAYLLQDLKKIKR